jgi:hypothetical protein
MEDVHKIWNLECQESVFIWFFENISVSKNKQIRKLEKN